MSRLFTFFTLMYGVFTQSMILQDKCCVTCTPPKNKYFYLNDTENTCSETCLTPKQYSIFKYEFTGLKQDDKSTLPCERYNYHIVDDTIQKGTCPLCTDFDVYKKDYDKLISIEFL